MSHHVRTAPSAVAFFVTLLTIHLIGCTGSVSAPSPSGSSASGSPSGTSSASGSSTPQIPYSTTFPLTESPISEGRYWINGKTTGLDWANVQTTSNLAFGTESGSGGYDDSTAILAGTWPADQMAQAVVHTVNQNTGIFEEVELRLRTTITAHSITGYEINFRCTSDGTQYVQIVRWNGPLGSFSYVNVATGPGLRNGDIIMANIVGSTITAYIDGVQVVQGTDSTYTGGNPGIGFFMEGGAPGVNADYGFTSFTASNASGSAATNAPASDPPVASAPASVPPATIAPSSDPPATSAPASDPPVISAPASDPPVTSAPASIPPATIAPSSDPPATSAPASDPPVTSAPASDPPVTSAPASIPPATIAPSSDPPATSAPASDPPVTSAPASDPPAISPPQSEAPTSSSSGTPTPYSTSFPLTENPISEGGNWLGGKATGVDWTDVQTSSGLAFGTQPGSGYDDSTAVLAGAWASDQMAQAVVHTVNQDAGIFEEVELRLRTTITAHSITGYEINFRCTSDGTQYVQIVRWNGPLGNFTGVNSASGPGLHNGDIIMANIVGSTITAYVNGVQVVQGTDSTYTSGNPGMGFFMESGAPGVNADFGFTSFTASNGLTVDTTPSTTTSATTSDPTTTTTSSTTTDPTTTTTSSTTTDPATTSTGSTTTDPTTTSSTTDTSSGPQIPYSTSFPLTENPISEGGNWVNGKTNGLDWADVQTTSGLAFGTESGSGGYDDSTAVLTGTWAPDQMAQAVVHTVNQNAGIFEEVELRLRTTITAHSITGYEINFRCTSDGTQYVQIVRWNGPLGSFTGVNSANGPGLHNGDIIMANIVGSTITAYVNGVQVVQGTDSTYASGNPGIGFFMESGAPGVNADFGFTSFAASND